MKENESSKELKTLKDLQDVTNPCMKCGSVQCAICYSDLRQVAIRWVKALRFNYCACHEEFHLDHWKDETECIGPNNVAVSWIMNFFNITEDELK